MGLDTHELLHAKIIRDANKIEIGTDIWLPHLVFVFDLNFKYSFQEVLKHQYIDNLYKRLDYQNIDTKKR